MIARHDRSQAEGERLVSWVRLFVALSAVVLLVVYMFVMTGQAQSGLRLATGVALLWAVSSGVVLAVLRRGYYHRGIAYLTVTVDVLTVTTAQIAMITVLPLTLVFGTVTVFYFLIVGLAALRGRQAFVFYAGIASAVAHLSTSVVVYHLYIPGGRLFGTLAGQPVQISFLDEIVLAFVLAVVAGLFSYVTKNLRRSERHYHDLFDQVPDGIVIAAAESGIRAVNLSFCQLVGKDAPALINQQLGDYLRGDWVQRALAHPDGPTVRSAVLIGRDDKKIPVHVVTTAMQYRDEPCVEMSIRDVSEKVELERQLFQSQKMETLGRLAGGLAHDLNNVLSGILGAASLADRVIGTMQPDPVCDKLQRQIRVINDCGGRARDTIHQLLALSRRGSLHKSPQDLVDIINDVATICRNTLGKAIDLQLQLPREMAAVEGDRTSITQALLNLCINAKDAMPDGGTLTIRLTAQGGDELAVPRDRETRLEQQYWTVTVEDTGTGMDRQTMDNIFDPFFTTKPVGEGTGLGLSMVYNIMQDHGGFVTVDSKREEGTRFRLSFARTRPSLIVNPPSEPAEQLPEACWSWTTKRSCERRFAAC